MTSAFTISQFPASTKGANSEVWRLVIIDDSPDDRVEVRRLLLKGSDRRYQFMESGSGESGLRMVLDADAGLPHCIVLDYHLPDMDAPEFLAAIAGPNGLPVCPVVVLTGSAAPELGQAVLRAGAQDFLGKSWMNPESLARAVENAAERWLMAREMRKKDAAFQESEAGLRLALESSSTGLWTWDLQTDAVTWSSECHIIHGVPDGEFHGTGEAFFHLVHPDDRARVEATVRAAIADNRLYECEFRIVRPNKEIVWVANRGRVQNADDRAPRMLGTITDVTDRKLAEEVEVERGKRLALLARTSEKLLLDQLPERELQASVFGELARLIDVEMFFHYAVEEPCTLRLCTSDGVPEADQIKFATIPFGEFLCGRVAESRTRLVIEDLQSGTQPGDEVLRALGATSYAGFPLAAGGRLLGTVAFVSCRQTHFRPGDVEVIQTACDMLAANLDRSRLLAEVKQAEDGLRLAAEVAGLGVNYIDYANQTVVPDAIAASLFGLEAGVQVPRSAVHDRFHPDDRDAINRQIELSLEPTGSGAFSMDHRVVLRDGSTRWLSVKKQILFGNVNGVRQPVTGVLASVDITARKESETALSRSEAFARSVVESSADCVKGLSLDGRLLWMNENGKRQMEVCDFDALKQCVWASFWDASGCRAVAEEAIATARAGRVGRFIGCCYTLAGSPRWWDVSITPIPGPDGQIEQLLAVSRDMTEQRAAERALARQNEGLAIMSEAAALLLSSDDSNQMVKSLMVKVARYIDAEVFVNYVVTQDKNTDHPYLKLEIAGGLDENTRRGFERLEMGQSLCGLTALNRTPKYLPDARLDTRPEATPLQTLGVASYMSCSLLAGDRVLGNLSFASMKPEKFGPDDLEFVQTISHQVAFAMERLRNEQEIAASESFYRQTLESIPGMVFTNTPDGACDYVSNQWVEFTGIPSAEQLGSGWVQVLHPEDRDRAFATWKNAVEGQGQYDLEYRVLRFDGAYEWFKVRGRAIRNEAGAIVRWLGTAVNINDLKQTEQALVLRERELQSLADNTPDILTRFDRNLRHVFVNAAVEKATGRPRTEFLGKTNRELGMSTALCEQWESATRYVFDRSQPTSLEFSFETHNGPRHYAAKLVPEFAADGTVEFVLGVTHDVTDRRQADSALRASEAQSRRQLQELDTIYQRTPVGMWLGDRECRFLRVNEVLAGVNGYPVEAHIGKTVRELVPGVADVIEPYYRRVVETGEPEIGFEVVGHTPSQPGVERTWVVTYLPLHGSDGEVMAVSGLVLELTLQKQAEKALLDADMRKDEFLATLAHELRNPLAPIRSGVAVLRADCTADESEMALAIIDRQLGHMVNLIDDLLDVSRVRTGKITLRKERVTIREAVEAAVEACKPTIDEKGHALEVSLSAESLEVNGDKTRLVQIVANLLTNAAKYSEPGASISLVVARDGDEAMISVSDNGMGISQETLPTLWDMFSQVRDTLDKAQGGLGIGLSLVKNLVQMHGGSVAAESEGLGKGSTFTVRLPLSKVFPNATSFVPAPKGVGGTRSGARRVLVVDDNVDGAKTLAMLLTLNGHKTAMAHRGQEAIETARTFRPEVVFLDIGLPGMDGYEVARHLRAEPDLSNVVLVALTGWGSEGDKQKSKEAGFDFHLTKPAEITAVQGILARLTSTKDTADA